MLTIRDLAVEFTSERGRVPAVLDVSLSVHPGQLLAVVGESGSGKSVTALAAMGLLPPSARITTGTIAASGRKAMIFQEPMSALNPSMTVGEQIIEAITLHQGLRGAAARRAARDALAEVGITDPDVRLDQYPHEFSGGMCQRVMIAIALACKPACLIADEPTTALDVTVQAQVLHLIDGLKRSRDLAILLITHDLSVVGDRADVVCVMYRGRVVEYGASRDVLADPLHPYTKALLACAPRFCAPRRDRLPTVAEMITPDSLRVTVRGRTFDAWWPLAEDDRSLPGAAGLARVERDGGGGARGGDRWICVRGASRGAGEGSYPDIPLKLTPQPVPSR